jgi:phytoene/squalene synthetase
MIEPQTESLSTASRIRFHKPHLERVSRSFAFGISRLEPRLRASVGLGYLICRLLDTVEDAAWDSLDQKLRAFTEFETYLLAEAIDETLVASWASKFPLTVSSGERLLLDDAAMVFGEFATLSSGERAAMLEPIRSMSRGMALYARREQVLRLSDLVDVNVYCFFVAGVVGELLTRLVNEESTNEMRPIGLDLATHFGLFLQKINVLKDQSADEAEGRFLVPDRELVFASLRENANGALEYLRAIPIERRDYRLFCAWALYLGLASVPEIRSGGTKISRLQAVALGARLELAISDNDRLAKIFDELSSRGWPTATTAIDDSAEGFSRARSTLQHCYSGQFDLDQLARLLSGSKA